MSGGWGSLSGNPLRESGHRAGRREAGQAVCGAGARLCTQDGAGHPVRRSGMHRHSGGGPRNGREHRRRGRALTVDSEGAGGRLALAQMVVPLTPIGA